MFGSSNLAAKMAKEMLEREQSKKPRRSNHSSKSATAEQNLVGDDSVTSTISATSHKSRSSQHGFFRRQHPKKEQTCGPKRVESPPPPPKPRTVTVPTSSNTGRALEQKKNAAQSSLRMIQTTIAIQEQRDEELSEQASQSIQEAKAKLSQNNQRGAVRYMKKAKRLQVEQDKVGSAIENLESMYFQIESSLSSLQVLDAMKAGNSAMKNLQNQDMVEQVDTMLLDIQDTLDVEHKIKTLLAAPVSMQHIFEDDDALLEELEQLAAATPSRDLDLPVPPSTPPRLQPSQAYHPNPLEKEKTRAMEL